MGVRVSDRPPRYRLSVTEEDVEVHCYESDGWSHMHDMLESLVEEYNQRTFAFDGALPETHIRVVALENPDDVLISVFYKGWGEQS